MSVAKVDVQNKELIKLVQEKVKGQYLKTEVEDILFNFILVVHDLLRQGKSFNLAGFGKVRPLARNPQIRYNPIRGSVGIIKPYWQIGFKPDMYAKQALEEAPMPDFVALHLQELEKEWEEEMQRESENPTQDIPLPKPKRIPRTSLKNKVKGKYNKSDKDNLNDPSY